MAKRKTKKFKGLHNLSAGLFGYRGWHWYKNEEESNAAKEEFFVLFSRYFYYFWE